jgi:hypothetical protein
MASTPDQTGLDGQRTRAVDTVNDGNSMAIASFVIGMLAATMAFLVLTSPGAILFGLIAIGLGIVGMGKANRLGGLNKGLAISGIVSGLLGVLVAGAILAGLVNLGNRAAEEAQSPEVQQRLDDLQNQLEQLNPS